LISGIPLPTTAIPNLALLVAGTGSLRFRDDGTAPTPSLGVLLATGLAPYEYSGDISQLALVGVSGTVAVSIAFYATRG
jgi:hypothetical protein